VPHDARVNGPAARAWPGDRFPEDYEPPEAEEAAGDGPLSPRGTLWPVAVLTVLVLLLAVGWTWRRHARAPA
jgi:hypothetical protein